MAKTRVTVTLDEDVVDYVNHLARYTRNSASGVINNILAKQMLPEEVELLDPLPLEGDK